MLRTNSNVTVMCVLFVTSLYLSIVAAAVNFTLITFSPNINLGQTADYQGSVNDTRVGIAWNINGNATLPNDFTVTGVGTQSSTLTIPGMVQYNNTAVRCVASGFVDGTGYLNSSESTLRLQGQLDLVIDLSCVLEGSVIQCNWSPPFSLTPIPNYIINITTDTSQLLVTNSTVYTNWSYCPSYYGNYTISIAGYNTVGEGKHSSRSVYFIPQANFTSDRVSYNYSTEEGRWILISIIKNGILFNPVPNNITAYLTEVNGTALPPIIRSGDGYYEGTDLIQRIDLGLIPNNTHWKLIIGLIYPSFEIYTLPTYDFRTFDVRNGSWSLDGIVIGRIGFTCHFVEGSPASGCVVTYRCDITDLNGYVMIKRNSSDKFTSITHYVDNFITSIYTISFYDLDDRDNPAYQSTGQNITGLPLSFTLTIPIVPPSTTVYISRSSPTPSINMMSSPQSTTGVSNKAIVAIGVGVPILLLLILLLLILLVVAVVGRVIFVKKQTGTTSEDKKSEQDVSYNNSNKSWRPADTSVQLQLDQINYTLIDGASTNLPQVPPSNDTTVPYNEVFLGIYDVATKTSPRSFDDPLYHRLDHNNGVHLPHQPEEESYDVLNRNNGTSTVPSGVYSTLKVNTDRVNGASDNGNYSTISKSEERHFISNKKELTHADLTMLLVPHLSAKWYEVGLALAITPDVLDEMEENRQGISDVFIQWEEGKTRPFTWDTLITILKSPTVNEPELAEQLEKELK